MSEPVQEQEQEAPQEPTGAPESDDEGEGEEESQEDGNGAETGAQGSAAPLSEKQMEQAFKRLDAEATRHRNRLSEIMGEDAQQLEVCPCCEPSMAGFMFPVHVAPISEEKQAAILELLGQKIGEEIVQDPDYTMCDHCQGYGRTLSGSKTLEHKTKICDKCGGNGYVQKPIEQRIPSLFQQAPTAVPPPAYQVTVPNGPPDAWDRPPGHAHYGIPPALVIA